MLRSVVSTKTTIKPRNTISNLNTMEAEGSKIEAVSRYLAILKPTIEALLKRQTPKSPIVQEKVDQAEKLIFCVPLELDSMSNYWQQMLASWWVKFAEQQAASTVSESEPIEPVSDDFDWSSKPDAEVPAVLEPEPILEPVPDDFNWASATEAEATGAAQAPALLASEPEKFIDPRYIPGKDFEWE